MPAAVVCLCGRSPGAAVHGTSRLTVWVAAIRWLTTRAGLQQQQQQQQQAVVGTQGQASKPAAPCACACGCACTRARIGPSGVGRWCVRQLRGNGWVVLCPGPRPTQSLPTRPTKPDAHGTACSSSMGSGAHRPAPAMLLSRQDTPRPRALRRFAAFPAANATSAAAATHTALRICLHPPLRVTLCKGAGRRRDVRAAGPAHGHLHVHACTRARQLPTARRAPRPTTCRLHACRHYAGWGCCCASSGSTM